MSLVISDLCVDIAGTSVLRGINLEIQPGRTLALVGRNGAGKTTTLRSVMGLLPIRSGGIMLSGTDLRQQPAHRRATSGVGYAPEERRLVGRFTVKENLLSPAWAQRLPRAEVEKRLALVDRVLPELAGISGRLGGLISGGQQKMVALGRALMSGHKVILLDEPFQGLAPALVASYVAALGALRETCPDLSIVITESNPALLRGLPGMLVTLERGQIVDTLPGRDH